MIEQMDNMPAGTLGFVAHGKVTADDYASVVIPDVEAAFQVNANLRVLYVIAADFAAFEPGATWDDARIGFRHFLGWDRVALVCDVPWLRNLVRATGFLIPARFRMFRLAELDQARAWICEGLAG